MIFRLASNKFSNEMGFSFFSMAILLAFLSMGSALIISMMSVDSQSGSAEVTFQKMDKIKAAISLYKTQNGDKAPNKIDDLVSKTGSPCSVDTNTNSSTYRTLQGWCGPYLDQEFTNSSDFKRDGWGTTFEYDKIILKSCGPNTKCGDSDDISLSI